MEFKEYEHFNDITIERWRKAIKLRRSGVREIYVSDSEIQTAYENIRDSVNPLFKLLVYSGVRLSQSLEGIMRLDKVVVKEDVARIPVNSISKGNKKIYWIYFPSTFLGELKQFDTSHNRHTYKIKNGLNLIEYQQAHYESGISTSWLKMVSLKVFVISYKEEQA